MRRIAFKSVNFEVDVKLRQDTTILAGDSGTGKTLLYKLIDRYMDNHKNDSPVVCIDSELMRNVGRDFILNRLKDSENKVIVIDSANYIFEDDDIAWFIQKDYKRGNYYLLMGRSLPLINNLMYLAEVEVTDNKIELSYLF